MATVPAPERDFRGPGCGPTCEIVKAIVPGRFGRSELLLHDPEAHERYGRRTGGRPWPPAADPLRVGPLTLDLEQQLVAVDGVLVDITRREWQILEYLASHSTRWSSAQEVTRAIWDEWTDFHTVHVYVQRLRRRLGDGAWTVQTRFGFGYRLSTLPHSDPPRVRSSPRWARAFVCCVCCGRADRSHRGHGRCDRCRSHPGPGGVHVGPCGAPPAVARSREDG